MTEQSYSDLIMEAQREVAILEDPIPWALRLCTQKEVDRIVTLSEEDEFCGWMYRVIRPLEGAASIHQNEKEPRVIVAVENVKKLIPQIRSCMERINAVVPNAKWERIGKEALLEKCKQALRILEEDFPAWGY